MSQSFLTDGISKNFEFNFSQVTPDGSSRSIFCRLCSQSLMVVEMLSGSKPSSSLLLIVLFSIGCALSAPDGSSPRGYGWILVVNHRLKLTSSPSFFFLFVSPRAEDKVSFISSMIHSFSLCYYHLLCAEFNSFVNMFMGLAITEAR
jgi:hypothetical protein